MSLSRLVVTLTAVATVGLAAQASAAAAPELLHFKSGGRIASGVVAKYDLKEESTDFEYRIRAERIKVAVFKRTPGAWKRIGVVRASPPKPLNFWRVFKSMGTGRYRLVARAVSGSGENREQSSAKRIRFRVVTHIPHDD